MVTILMDGFKQLYSPSYTPVVVIISRLSSFFFGRRSYMFFSFNQYFSCVICMDGWQSWEEKRLHQTWYSCSSHFYSKNLQTLESEIHFYTPSGKERGKDGTSTWECTTSTWDFFDVHHIKTPFSLSFSTLAWLVFHRNWEEGVLKNVRLRMACLSGKSKELENEEWMYKKKEIDSQCRLRTRTFSLVKQEKRRLPFYYWKERKHPYNLSRKKEETNPCHVCVNCTLLHFHSEHENRCRG